MRIFVIKLYYEFNLYNELTVHFNIYPCYIRVYVWPRFQPLQSSAYERYNYYFYSGWRVIYLL